MQAFLLSFLATLLLLCRGLGLGALRGRVLRVLRLLVVEDDTNRLLARGKVGGDVKQLVRTGGSVRPGAAGLFIGIECSRVWDSSWMYLTSLVTTRIGVELAAVQRKLSDLVVVGLQLYSARTFHVILSPRIYKGGQGPPQNNQHLRQYKQPHKT